MVPRTNGFVPWLRWSPGPMVLCLVEMVSRTNGFVPWLRWSPVPMVLFPCSPPIHLKVAASIYSVHYRRIWWGKLGAEFYEEKFLLIPTWIEKTAALRFCPIILLIGDSDCSLCRLLFLSKIVCDLAQGQLCSSTQLRFQLTTKQQSQD